jgi:hypothetical protein
MITRYQNTAIQKAYGILETLSADEKTRILAEIREKALIMFNSDGIIESAFVIERPQQYLNKPVFERIGLMNEVNYEL